MSKEKIILGNRACPFGSKVIGNESLCMMTSNVFGTITAQNLGYAQISLEKTISRNDKECRIVIYLSSNKKVENHAREYFKI